MALFEPEPGEIVYLNDDGTRRAPWEHPYCLCPPPITMHLWPGHPICPDCGRTISLSHRSDWKRLGRPWVPRPTGTTP